MPFHSKIAWPHNIDHGIHEPVAENHRSWRKSDKTHLLKRKKRICNSQQNTKHIIT